MVSWRMAAFLALVLALIGAYAYWSVTKPVPPAERLMPCDVGATVYLKIEGERGRVLELERSALDSRWRLKQPVEALGNTELVDYLIAGVHSVKVMNTLEDGGDPARYGLGNPHSVVTCRVKKGSSYTLSVGKESFDSSGFYARRSGLAKLYVISGVQVDQFDRALTELPVQGSPSPSVSVSPSR
jgi:hypothetical protein